ncbi:MAG: 3-phosphoshikimate 1-carboxyvinyltransferase [Alphaproteobacteria bacterium]|nr:MAG: 3-phosphoshikimate 1-carboxyvinyltransferase [Alphaproteobacteria bacterium]
MERAWNRKVSIPDVLVAQPSRRLTGKARVPGDKSISHRALMFGACAVGISRVMGLLESADVLATATALRAMGVPVSREAKGVWTITGRGSGGLSEPVRPIDCGNSGTSARLLAGLVASQPIRVIFTGDDSLSRRPMRRIMRPLAVFGARITARNGEHLPLVVEGARDPLPVCWRPEVASAQVKSAILLAALNTPGRTTVIESTATRDHSERMLRAMGAALSVERTEEGHAISIEGPAELHPFEIAVPGDPSSAAFPMVAALIVEEGEVRLPGIGLNPTRTGLIDTLVEMGADIAIANRRTVGGEPVGDIMVRGGRALTAVSPDPAQVPAMIDEFPILFVAAACAKGRSIFRGIGDLRAKESDRIAEMAKGLSAMGVRVEEGPDCLVIEGVGGPLAGDVEIDAAGDHRIAMAFAVAGLAARAPVRIRGSESIATSFPGFVDLMRDLGARILEAAE